MKTRIYVLLDENGEIRYVGKTIRTLDRRLSFHIYDIKRGIINHKCNWIRSMLLNGFTPKIQLIQEVEGNGSDEEIYWIAFFRKAGIKLTNGTNGGDNGYLHSLKSNLLVGETLRGRKRPEEVLQKMRGQKRSEESRRKMSLAKIGKKRKEFSKETIFKMKSAQKGRVVSLETRQKMKGRVVSLETRQKISESLLKKNSSFNIGEVTPY